VAYDCENALSGAGFVDVNRGLRNSVAGGCDGRSAPGDQERHRRRETDGLSAVSTGRSVKTTAGPGNRGLRRFLLKWFSCTLPDRLSGGFAANRGEIPERFSSTRNLSASRAGT
jgi:hypothetical protein